ncbi:Lactate utilization protein A [bacterium HR10]|nr:Lactate utilization protein A [bacterium HR10]
MPTREVYWNIHHVWIMYALLVPTLLIFGYGVYRRLRLWRRGRPYPVHWKEALPRAKAIAIDVLAHRRMLREAYSGLSHLALFAGFLILFIGTLVVMVHEDFKIRIMRGAFYLYFQSLALDLFGLLAILGLAMLAAKRYLMRPARLHVNVPEREGASRQRPREDALLLAVIFLILVTGFLIEGLRIAATRDPWGQWSPVGWLLAQWFHAHWEVAMMREAHQFLWWFHLVLTFGLIAWLPYTKLLHIFTAAGNIFLRPLEPARARLAPLDLETAQTLGVARIEDFTWKDLLDLDACTECGRCQQECPATATGKPLSPKTLILDLREALSASGKDSAPLIGRFISEETLWSCTTCLACTRACPVFIEHVPKIVGMRRYLVMEEARVPELMAETLRSLEDRGHPFRGATLSRTDWCRDLSIPSPREADQVDFLLWVGCASALNERNHRVVRALVRALREAGLRFAILGAEERCTGDPARRIGNEYLFEQLARENIRRLNAYGVRRIVTVCPHCFNCFAHEYPHFGGQYEVIHHSQLLADLVRAGRLHPRHPHAVSVTYHDPCYLGRYNDIYDAPRDVLRACARDLREMSRCRDRAFCCGAGGGLMWTEEPGRRINHERAQQALRTEAPIIAVSCPFCLIMLEEGITAKAEGRTVEVLDIAEVLERTLDREPT